MYPSSAGDTQLHIHKQARRYFLSPISEIRVTISRSLFRFCDSSAIAIAITRLLRIQRIYNSRPTAGLAADRYTNYGRRVDM